MGAGGGGPGGPQAGKQLADFTGHIIFYGHPKKNVRHWRVFFPLFSLSLSLTQITAGFLSPAWPEELGSPTGTSQVLGSRRAGYVFLGGEGVVLWLVGAAYSRPLQMEGLRSPI